MFRSTAGPKEGAVFGLFDSPHDVAGDAPLPSHARRGIAKRLLVSRQGETSGGIVSCKRFLQTHPALRNYPNSTPFLVTAFKHLRHQGAGCRISLFGNSPFIGIFNLIYTRFQLKQAAVNTIEQVGRFEPGDDQRCCRAGSRVVLGFVPGYSTDMTSCQETVHAWPGVCQDRLYGRWNHEQGGE